MMKHNIKYHINHSSIEDIISHWKFCNEIFLNSLSQQMDLEAYALKICTHAIRFEAWENNLVGLVACYLNDESGMGYITNVSIAEGYEGKGIARQLVEQCIAHANEIGFKMINLEVEENNLKAIGLYENLGFTLLNKQSNGKLLMQKKIDFGYEE